MDVWGYDAAKWSDGGRASKWHGHSEAYLDPRARSRSSESFDMSLMVTTRWRFAPHHPIFRSSLNPAPALSHTIIVSLGG